MREEAEEYADRSLALMGVSQVGPGRYFLPRHPMHPMNPTRIASYVIHVACHVTHTTCHADHVHATPSKRISHPGVLSIRCVMTLRALSAWH